MSNEVYTTYALYCLARYAVVVVVSHNRMSCRSSSFSQGSFEPLAPKPQVANELAKGAKDKSQTQGDEEYGEGEDDNRRDAASFISPNRGPCCTT